MEGVEVEISDSSRSILGNGKENKEVSHVLAMVVPKCVDLTKDQFPKMVDRMPSNLTISSLVKEGSKKATNPLTM